MAHPPPSSRPLHQQQPQRPGGDQMASGWRHQNPTYNASYQQDWGQENYDYQQNYDEGQGYEQYDAGAYDGSQDTGYQHREQGRPPYDQGYGGYNGPAGPHKDPRHRGQGPSRGQHRPPMHGAPPPRPMNGDRPPPRPRPRGPPSGGGPPIMQAYGPNPTPGPRPPRDPRDPRAMRPPPHPQDRRRPPPPGQSPMDHSGWENPSRMGPSGIRERPDGRRSLDARPQQRAGMDDPGYMDTESSGYSNGDPRMGPNDYQHRSPPPHPSHMQRPGTSNGPRGGPPPRKLDIPQKSLTQPPTPVRDQTPHAISPGLVQSPNGVPQSAVEDPREVPNFQLPERPGTAPGRPQPANGAFGARSSSPEEMPAFHKSTGNSEPDPLHRDIAKVGSNPEYVPYSPVGSPPPRNIPDQPGEAVARSYTQPYQDSGPQQRAAGGSHPPRGESAPSQGRPPLRRIATEGEHYENEGRAPGPHSGPPQNYPRQRDQRAFGNNVPSPQLDHRANSFGDPPRNGPGPPPDRRNGERPNFYGNMPGPADGRKPQNPSSNGLQKAQRSSRPSSNQEEFAKQAPVEGAPGPGGSSRQQSDPDALPYHPTPVRPGLTPNESSQSMQHQKPPPVRQQTTDSHAPAVKPVPTKITSSELSRLRKVVQESPFDRVAKLTLAKKLSEASVVLADDGGRADLRMRNHNRDRYNKEALEIVKGLVSNDYPDAMFFLAESYGDGSLGLKQDAKEAFVQYQSAAKMGHPAGAYRTAVCCEIGAEEGGGTKRDTQKAIQWYKRAASLGDIPATYKLGMISLRGLLGQPKNLGEAVQYLKKAADNANEENPHAVHELALLYESPSNPEMRDEGHSVELFKRAGKLGYKFSQFKLGQAYEYGLLGCPVDARSSIVWYTKAAAQGEHESELALSGWYLTGSDGILEHNDTEAYLWARKAASADPPLGKAMFAMGYFTETGIGCPRSLDEAKKWYARAASGKHPKAQEKLDELRRNGSKVQKGRERLSRSNQKQNEENCVVM